MSKRVLIYQECTHHTRITKGETKGSFGKPFGWCSAGENTWRDIFSWSRHRWQDVLLQKYMNGQVMKDSLLMTHMYWSALHCIAELHLLGLHKGKSHHCRHRWYLLSLNSFVFLHWKSTNVKSDIRDKLFIDKQPSIDRICIWESEPQHVAFKHVLALC